MLGALYGGKTEAEQAVLCTCPPFSDEREQVEKCRRAFFRKTHKHIQFPSIYLLHAINEVMSRHLGIVRDETSLLEGIKAMDFYIHSLQRIKSDRFAENYLSYSLYSMAQLGKAVLLSAMERKESRGAHFRADYPQTYSQPLASYAVFEKDKIEITMEKDVGQA